MPRGNRNTGSKRVGKRFPGTTRGQDVSARGKRLDPVRKPPRRKKAMRILKREF